MASHIFAQDLESFGNSIAVITQSGEQISYQSLASLADSFSEQLPQDSRQLMLLAADNSLEAIVGYLSALRSNIPVILIPHDKPDAFKNISAQFKPTLTYVNQDGEYVLSSDPDNGSDGNSFPSNLAVCLSTSGTTGSAKLVKLSVTNINANAVSIAEYLQLDETERAMLSLPMYYSYGLSVINSHLSIGASIVLNSGSVIEDQFWELFNDHQCTSFAGVPYSYELLNRSGFDQKHLPTLRYMTQAGGKLPKELVEHFTKLSESNGWRFYVMYGQTEATARMSYLPPDQTLSHLGSMGIVIPGGRFELIDEQGQIIKETNQSGELIYYGPNVMMGYGVTREDLFEASILDRLQTGDIAWRDKDDFYYISGRKSRFLKIFGNRIGLDEIENTLRGLGYVSICGGTDQHLIILTLEQGKSDEIAQILANKYQLNSQYATVEEVKDFPLLPSGKIDYQHLVKLSQQKVQIQLQDAKNTHEESESARLMSGQDIFKKVFVGKKIQPDSTFKSLGGDSINYVQMMVLLERKLGEVPTDWQDICIKEIDQIKVVNNNSKFYAIESNILLRAVAITSILAHHTQALPITIFGGSSIVLFMLFGYSFAQFQLSKFLNGDIWKTVYSFSIKLVVPYLIICGLFLSYFATKNKSVDYDMLFMTSNLYRLQTDSLQSLWFIQVLMQIIAFLGILLSVKYIRNKFKANILKTSFILLITSVLTYFTMRSMFDTAYLLDRLPHLIFPFVMIGWTAYLVKNQINKLMLAIISISYITLIDYFNYAKENDCIWYVISILTLIFLPKIRVPKLVAPIFTEIASASYYLYFAHVPFIYIISKFMDHSYPYRHQLTFTILCGLLTVFMTVFYKVKGR